MAMVYGTSFDIHVGEENEILFVRSGEVLFKGENNEESFLKYDKGIATKEEVIRAQVSREEIELILKANIERVQSLKDRRIVEIEKNSFLLGVAKKTYGLTKEDILQKLDDVDKGYIDDAALIEKAPFKKDELRKIKAINDQIKTTNSEIQYILDKFNLSLE
ncbi:MAG: hypothetical protein PF569_04105 [Candidatus Woesearchaeota archaeon]|jgi:hypothetical protein|nr:hypothetical protein [Candidatus Woesearchaeota archaeon]